MRISGITIKDNKRLAVSLTGIYGIGFSRAKDILAQVDIDPEKHAGNLSKDEENLIRTAVGELRIEGDLKREISENIKRLKDIKSYRGSRHDKHLPGRGQRTKTNSRTVRGNVRRTMGSGKRKLEKK
ncbi:30S ribosomal protein S13 [Patescibacteria group bacterium]|nr:30S ribosomal protein S13 [Patescibacteria group bacterium]